MDCSAEIEGDGACRARGVREWVIKMCSCYSCTFVCMLFFVAWSVYSVVLLLCAKRKPLLQKYFTPQMRGNETSNELRNCSLKCFFFFQFRTNQGRSQRVALRAREPPHHPKFFGARSCVERRRRWRCNRWTWKKKIDEKEKIIPRLEWDLNPGPLRGSPVYYYRATLGFVFFIGRFDL